MKYYYRILFFFVCIMACQKVVVEKEHPFVTYTIRAGEQYADYFEYEVLTSITEMKFVAVFDSSAIYTSAIPTNQEDVNKLYGFADNNMHHHFNSARIGWRWFNNELQLFAYVYNNAVRSFVFIKSVNLLQAIHCAIKINGNKYLFTVDGTSIEMPRTASVADGYKLFPYFGGDEFAPHEIRIRIKDM